MNQITTRQTNVQTGCVLTEGGELYYEVRGHGQPLIMIHGGGPSTSRECCA